MNRNQFHLVADLQSGVSLFTGDNSVFLIHTAKLKIIISGNQCVSGVIVGRRIEKNIHGKCLRAAVDHRILPAWRTDHCGVDPDSNVLRLSRPLLAQHVILKNIGARANLIHLSRLRNLHARRCGACADLGNGNAGLPDLFRYSLHHIAFLGSRDDLILGGLIVINQTLKGINTSQIQIGKLMDFLRQLGGLCSLDAGPLRSGVHFQPDLQGNAGGLCRLIKRHRAFHAVHRQNQAF